MMTHSHSTQATRVHRRRRTRVAALVAAGSLMLAGCGLFDDGGGDDGGNGGNGDPEAESGGSITVQLTNFAHIDPQSITFGMWLVQMGLLEGLVLQTPDGTDVRPGMADEWDVSDDGLEHTFHIRDGASWSNGEPVTAEDFVWTYQRLLDPDRGPGGVTTEASSYQAPLGIENATAYNTGALDDFDEVGIEAVDDQTLVFTLEAPNPGFVMGMTHPSMLPLNPDAVQGDDNWQQPENWVGNGPYNLTDWVANSSMVLESNPEYWDAENVALDSINVELMEQGAISTTVPYENGQVDIQGLGEPADISRFMADPELSEQVNLLENSGTSYLAVLHSENTLLEDPEIRSALSLGLGREQIAGISEITEPASTLVSPITPDWSDDIAAHDDMTSEAAIEEAQQMLADAGYPDGEGFPTLKLLAGSDFPQLDVIVDMMQTNLGITMEKDVVEVGVYVERRAELHDENYVGFWYGSFSGVSTWPYQVEQLWGPEFVQQTSLGADAYGEYLDLNTDDSLSPSDRNTQIAELLDSEASEEANAFVDGVNAAKDTVDEAEQHVALQQAAAHREAAEVFIPLVWNSTVVIAQPRVQGLELRAQADRYYFKDLWVDEDAE